MPARLLSIWAHGHERFEDKVHGADAVIDLVGGATLSRSYAVVKQGGVIASTVQPPDESRARQAGIHSVHVVMKRKAADLTELAWLVEQGVVKPRMAETMSLADAPKAQQLSEQGRTHGKVILKVA
jgi:NADPH:quinone reductase-like Zn-dependent oxidoreductase